MPVNRRSLWIFPALLGPVLLLAACGGGGSGSTGSPGPGSSIVASPINARYLPVVISEDLAVGTERFQMGLIDQQNGNVPITGAKMHLKFYLLNQQAQSADLKFEADATPVTITKSYTHTHADGTIETHTAGETGSYIDYAAFDVPGVWGVEVTGTLADGTNIVGDGEEPTRPFFQVSQISAGLAVGDPTPPVKQTILSDVANITSIDTSQTPIPGEHDLTVADAIVSGKPTVIAFATPAFCVSEICGPTKEIFDGLYQKYSAQANFIHIEPYDVDKARAGNCPNLGDCIVPAMNAFRLQSEPWVFVIDAQGKIAAKFDGIVSEAEMEQALLKVLGATPAASATQ